MLSPQTMKLHKTALTHFTNTSDLQAIQSDVQEYEYILDSVTTCDNSSIAIALSTFSIQLRDYHSLKQNSEFRAHDNTINEIATSRTNPWQMMSCSSDKTIKLWDLRTKSPAMTLSPREPVWTCSLNSTDTVVAAGTDAKVHFFDVRTGQKSMEYCESHMDAVTKVRFHPSNDRNLVTASEDGVVNLFDVSITEEDEAAISIFNVESAVTKFSFFGQNLESICCLTGSETMDLWNLQSATRIAQFSNVRQQCADMNARVDYLVDCKYDAAHDRLYLVAGDHTGTLRLLHVTPSGLVCEKTLVGGHKACIRSIYWDATTLFTGGEDSRLCAWRNASTKEASTSSRKDTSRRQRPHTAVGPYARR